MTEASRTVTEELKYALSLLPDEFNEADRISLGRAKCAIERALELIQIARAEAVAQIERF